MTLGKEFIKSVKTGCDRALINTLGYKRRYQTLYLDFHDDYSGWLGIGTTTRERSDAMGIWVNAGVVCWPVHNLVYDCNDDEQKRVRRKDAMPTVMTPIGCLIWPPNGHYELWFPKDDPLEDCIQRLVEDVRTYVLPYYQNHANLTAIIRTLEDPKNNFRDGVALLAAYVIAETNSAEDLAKFKEWWLASGKVAAHAVPKCRAVMEKILAHAQDREST